MKHPYHCVLCGTQLVELGLGCLACPNEKCETQFIPTCNKNETEFSVTWQANICDLEEIERREQRLGFRN